MPQRTPSKTLQGVLDPSLEPSYSKILKRSNRVCLRSVEKTLVKKLSKLLVVV